MPFEVPEGCTLPTAVQPLRQAEFAALCSTALRNHERLTARHLRLNLTGGKELLATVRDLADRESQCCSFFEFTVTSDEGVVVLDIVVPAANTDVLDGLGELASRSAPRIRR